MTGSHLQLSVFAASLQFYSTSAQVIPVLFLALAFETRAFGRLDRPPEKDVLLAGIRLYAFLLIVWGEAQALHVLSSGRASHRAYSAVTAALITAGVLLALESAIAFLRAGVAQAPTRFRPYIHFALRAVLVVAGVALMAIGVVLMLHGE